MYNNRQGGLGLIVYVQVIEDVLRFSSGADLTSEFQRWYPPRDLSVESIQNLKSKILKPPHLSVGQSKIENLKSKID